MHTHWPHQSTIIIIVYITYNIMYLMVPATVEIKRKGKGKGAGMGREGGREGER